MREYNRLTDIQSALQEGSITCREVVEDYLNRIRDQQALNAFIEVYEEEALQRADTLDQKIANGESIGRLYGLVIGVKDVICQQDHHVSASSAILEGFTSLYSSTAVARLLEEDAIVIGRLNCDEFAMGSSNENSTYGPVRNALDHERVPGGSSGGSAVAVQADLCHASLGTETGGSIRQPASFCGVMGLKPTYGRVSRYGLIAYASSFDQIGPFTKSPEDAALILEVMAGPDEYDATASTKEVPKLKEELNGNGAAHKIAYFPEVLAHDHLQQEVKQGTQSFISQLQDAGHQVDEVNFPYLDYLVPAYYILTTAEASSNLARYDGMRYGKRYEEAETMDEAYKKSRSNGFGQEVKRRIMLGTFVLSEGYYDAYYAKAQKLRRLILEQTQNILSDYDFILMPTTPTSAFKIGDKIDDPVSMYLADIFTVQANLTGMPALSLPFGKDDNNLPFGIQFMAGKFQEGKLLSFANSLL